MKALKSILLFMVIIMLGYSLRSCLNDSYSYSDFMIKVDSIHVADTVTLNTPFDIEFFGIIGFNGCCSFKTFNQSITDNDITIEAWGVFENKNGICPTVLVFLDGQKVNMTIRLPGIYNIKIRQPDNSSIVRKITVE
jgi:hypothetical protein